MIFVLGQRAGTSMLVNILSHLGFRFALDRVIKTTEANPDGFYEDGDIVDFNNRLLFDAGGRPRGHPWHFPPTIEQIDRVGAPYLEPAEKLLKDRQENSHPFVIKDPRLVWAWPVWFKSLVHLHARTGERATVVCMTRYLLDQVKSLHRWNGQSRDFWKNYLKEYYGRVDIIQDTAEAFGGKFLYYSYDAILENPAFAAAQISEDLVDEGASQELRERHRAAVCVDRGLNRMGVRRER